MFPYPDMGEKPNVGDFIAFSDSGVRVTDGAGDSARLAAARTDSQQNKSRRGRAFARFVCSRFAISRSHTRKGFQKLLFRIERERSWTAATVLR